MPFLIVLLGAGGIGQRHLEALALSPNQFRIFVVDPRVEALATTRELLPKICKDADTVSLHTSVEEVPSEVDATIVATTADVRRQAVETLLKSTRPRWLILEKVLFQRPDDYDVIAERLEKEEIGAWVNCPRRLWPQYQHLREEISDTAGLTMYVKSGPAVGLGSNAIHMLDLLAFLSPDEDLDVDVSRLQLYEGPTKRNAIEFVGTLVAQTKHGSVLVYSTLPRGDNPFQIEVELPGLRAVFDEGLGIGRRATTGGDWKWTDFQAPPVYQSRLTHRVIDQLIAQGSCELTGYTESAALHLPLIRALAKRLEALGIRCGGEVRIT